MDQSLFQQKTSMLCSPHPHLNPVSQKLFGTDCRDFGSITQYADDATYSVANKKRELNAVKVTENLERLSVYLNSNGLNINMDKTHLIEIMIQQKRRKIHEESPKLTVYNSSHQSEDTSKSYGMFEEKIREVLGNEAPMRNIQLRSSFKSWIDTETKDMMENRDRLRQIASTSQLPADWKKFRVCRNKCSSQIRRRKN